MNKEQKSFTKGILKKYYKEGYKLADIVSNTYYPFEEYPETVLWYCDIAYVIGEGIYWIVSISQENNEYIKIHYTTISDGLFAKLKEKQKAFDRNRERRRRECGYGLGR